ncbi:MAG: hypothetical protein E6Q95_06205 [Chitinophagaceae bacterium]|nr:MAG: hypothetical protein E6Q95_06205 [Chitinophagaceae bacterium]
MGSVLSLFVLLWIALQFTVVQNWLIHKVTSKLSKDLQTKIEIKHVDFSLFNKMHLQGVLVEDRQKDTILSAGELSVNINDWFFVKDNIDLKYIGLKNAIVKLQRTDSVWRHDFLIDYFSSPTPSTKKKQKNTIQLSFKKIDLENIRFEQNDHWLGQDMHGFLGSLYTEPENVNFDKQIIALQSVTINNPIFSIKDYKGNRPANYKKAKKSSVSSAKKADENKWQITSNFIKIVNGGFKTINEKSKPEPGYFDGMNIDFSNINADFKDVMLLNDSLTSNLNLSTQERSGLQVKKLKARVIVTAKEMTFSQLDLETNKSRLQNYFSMQYAGIDRMASFIDSVTLVGKFDNANVHTDDISFFAPAMKTWKKNVKLKGFVEGPVSALEGKNLDIDAGTTVFTGDASITGLPDINSSFLVVNAKKLQTNYVDLVTIVPDLKPITTPDLSSLQYFNFNGVFTGFINDFVTQGTLTTALGTVKTDVNMKLPAKGNPIYSGNIATQSFNLGALLKDSAIGFISTETELKGAGFDPQKGNIRFNSKIHFFDYNQYRYNNIDINGEFSAKYFDGKINSKDSNALFSLNGLVDFSKKEPAFDFVSSISHINFKKLNLYNRNLSVAGNINAHFTGKSIDDFLGTASMSNVSLMNDGFPLSFDSLHIHSFIQDSVKNLSVLSNEFAAHLKGKFNLEQLPNSFTSFLSKYYPSYIKAPAKKPANQNFSFDIKTYEFEDFAHLLDSSISGLNYTFVSGTLNTNENNLFLDASTPFFAYNNIRISDIKLNAVGNYENIVLNGSTGYLDSDSSVTVDYSKFNITSSNDISNVMLNARGSSTLENVQLNAVVKTYEDGVNIKLLPTNLVLNGKTWAIEKDGILDFRTNSSAKGELILRESNQEIKINTIPSSVGSWNDVAISISNLNLSDISPFILPHNRLEGLANANVLLENPGKNMRVYSHDFDGKHIVFDNDSLGNFVANVEYDLPTSILKVNGNAIQNNKSSVDFTIDLFMKDKESQKQNIISVQPKEFELKHLNRFLGFLFSDIKGSVTGNFNIKGPFDGLGISGKGKIKNGGLKVNFTQCYYTINDTEISLKEDEINLDGIVLKDVVTKNPIYLSGGILHNSFENMFYDITVSTRKPGTRTAQNNLPVQVLQTSIKDNNLFFGDVKATGSFSLVGPENNTYMSIDAIASTMDSSSFTIASSNSKAGKMPDWMVEGTHGIEINNNNTLKKSNMLYDLDVTVNNMVNMHFLMDDYTGDEMNGRGYGNLAVRSGTSEPLSIRGKLHIEEGDYRFTLQSFFSRPFIIKKGTDSYINWTGDPLAADMNIKAQYKAERVSFAPLSGKGQNLDNSYSRARDNVLVNATLTGKLTKPQFTFGLELEPNSQFANDFNIANSLQQMEKNEGEMIKQVSYLIVFNSFAPQESGVVNSNLSNSVNEFGYSTISSLSGLLFNEINQSINTQLSKIFKTNISFSFSGSIYNKNILNEASKAFNPNQANFNSALLIPFFKDRLVISLGGNLEVPLESTSTTYQQNVQFLPDITIAWLMNKSGSIRFNFFYKENLDLLASSSNGSGKAKRFGLGFSFRKEFDTLSELFKIYKAPKLVIEDTNIKKTTDTLQKNPIQDSTGLQ